MMFKAEHKFINACVEFFTEDNAPKWITSADSVVGSTMDYRWFFDKKVLKLNVGQSVETDFRTITRIK